MAKLIFICSAFVFFFSVKVDSQNEYLNYYNPYNYNQAPQYQYQPAVQPDQFSNLNSQIPQYPQPVRQYQPRFQPQPQPQFQRTSASLRSIATVNPPNSVQRYPEVSNALPGTISQLASGPVRGVYTVQNGSYSLEWEVNPPLINFKATRRGYGFIGFAISASGGMAGADIFISGIDPNGMPFSNDFHHEYLADGTGAAVPDVSNDYTLQGVQETGGYTVSRFTRLLDTRDVPQDHKIVNGVQNILWSVGPPSRTLAYHGPSNRGLVKVNLLNPAPEFRLN